MSEFLPVYRDRPSIVPSGSGRVFISIHDAEHLRQRGEWKRKLADAHPDRGGTSFGFRKLVKQREQWDAEELQWYAQYGLMLPDASVPTSQPAIPAELLRLADSRTVKTSRRRVAGYLADHPDADDTAIGAALGLSRNVVASNRRRLKRLGPTFTKFSTSMRLFQLLADGQPHTVDACWANAGARSNNEFARALDHLVLRGFDIVREIRPRRGLPPTYRLVSAPLLSSTVHSRPER